MADQCGSQGLPHHSCSFLCMFEIFQNKKVRKESTDSRLSSSVAHSALFPSTEASISGGHGQSAMEPGLGAHPSGWLSRRRLPACSLLAPLMPWAPGANLQPSHPLRPQMDVPGNLTDTKRPSVSRPDFHFSCFASLWTDGLARHLAGKIHLAEGSVRRPAPATPKGTGKQFQL